MLNEHRLLGLRKLKHVFLPKYRFVTVPTIVPCDNSSAQDINQAKTTTKNILIQSIVENAMRSALFAKIFLKIEERIFFQLKLKKKLNR